MTAIALLLMLTLAARAVAQTGGVFDLSWFTADSGGGASSGGAFSVEGTIGQADAARESLLVRA